MGDMMTRRELVLLHGWATHPDVFRGFARALEKHARVIVLALPGYAETASCTPYTLERIADTLAAAAPKHCCVVGWSLGAQVALTWARRAPNQVEQLALISATPCFVRRAEGANAWPHGVTPMLMRQFTTQLQRDAPTLLRRFVALQGQGDKQAVRVAHKLRTALFTHALPAAEVLQAGLEILSASDLRGELAKITQPTLVIHGENDAVTPCAAGRALSKSLSCAQFHAVPGTAHAPFLAAPDVIAEHILAFFHATHVSV